MYCPNCFAFIADDATICPKCNCAVKTDGGLPQEVIAAEVASQKQGYGFEKYSIYETRMYVNSTYKKTEDEKHNADLKYLTPICIAISFGILIFGLDELTVINAIIATILGCIASVILRKILDISHADEVEGRFITYNEEKTLLSSQYAKNVLEPLEDNILSKISSLYPRVDFSNTFTESVKHNRAFRIWSLFEKKQGKWPTLQEYSDEIYNISKDRILREWVGILVKETDNEKSDLMTKAGLYRKELYSSELNALLSDVDELRYPSDRDEKGLKKIQKIRETIESAKASLQKEQEILESYFSKVSVVKNTFKIMKKKIKHLLYFSKEFQETLHIVESSSLITPKTKISFDKLKDKVDRAEYSLNKLQTLFDLENIAVNELYEQQKKLADELTEKLETVLSQNNDVKYGNEIDSMISEIRKLISVYENGATALNTELVNEKIRILEKARKRQRSDIFNMIQSYDKQLRELQKAVKIYERPNAGEITRKFLERKMSIKRGESFE